jgi:putative colanic acid biosynthesis acetyltransferase WcaF
MNYAPVQHSPFSISYKIKMHVWKLVNKTIFRFSPAFFKAFRVFLLRIFGANVDYKATVNRKSTIDCPWNLTMASQSSLGEGAWAYCLDQISIGADTCIGKDVYLITGSHAVDDPGFKLITAPISIGRGCWVATGAYILPGVEVGDFAVVGARAIVNRNVEPSWIVGGNPAKKIRPRKLLADNLEFVN